MLTEDIKSTILSSGFAKGDKLPSIRKMAIQLGVSTGLVNKVYGELASEGIVKPYRGKGFFFGGCDIPEKVRKSCTTPSLEQLFRKDLDSGFLSSFSRLPSLKELANRYGTSLYLIRKFLNNKAEQGILKKCGTRFTFLDKSSENKPGYVIFVHKSDNGGHFFIDSERVVEVFRIFNKFAHEQGISVRYLCYSEKKNRLLDTEGNSVTPTDSPNCLGAFVSTWLVKNPSVLFSHFSKCTYPISVWWENTADKLAKISKDAAKWAYFDVSFGKNVGTIVGRFMKQKGMGRVNYLSPFHGSDWSRMREEGLVQEGLSVNSVTNPEIYSPREIIAEAENEGVDPQMSLREHIRRLLPKAIDAPFVCANDWVAAALVEILESEGKKRPYIIGFDNNAESYRYCFDSFAFNVDAMVQEALFHIIAPSNYAFFKKQVQTPPGKVVEKG